MPTRARRVLVAVAVAWAVADAASGCAPETDLTNVPDPGAESASPGGIPGATLVDPVAGATDVPVNLSAVVVRFASPVIWGAAGLRVCDATTGPAAAILPTEVPCDEGRCYSAALAGSLPAALPCRVTLGAGTEDAEGAAVPAGIIGIFDTAAAADVAPPVLSDVALQGAGPCLEVGFATDEPASGTVVVSAGGTEVDRPAGVGQTKFDVAIPFAALPPSSAATLTVKAIDRAGNVASSPPLAFTTPAVLPPVAITEVLANPAGPEPAQEYVELRNLGGEAVPLAGLRIADSKGGDDLPPQILAPGGYALVVTSTYDPAQGQDPTPRAGTLLVRVDTRIGSDGLSNSGEPVKLMQGDAVVSSYGGWVDVSSSPWAGHAVHRLIQSACDRAGAWNRTPLAPTPGAGPP